MHYVKLREYKKASRTLQEIQEPDLWNRKVEFSIAKLCASIEDQPTDVLTQSLNILGIQSKFRESLKPTINEAIDSEAAVQLVMAENKWSKKAPYHGDLLRRLVRRVLSDIILGIEDMIDALTLHIGPPTRFYTALQLLNMADISESRRNLAMRTIWRRIFLADDWIKIVDTKNKSDDQVSKQTRQTALYEVISRGVADELFQSRTKLRPFFPGEALFLPTDEDTLRSRFRNSKEQEFIGLLGECDAENQLLRRYEEKARLSVWANGLVKDAESHLLHDGFALIDAEDIMDE
ncbi:Nucleoporin NUP133 [Neolecta irregularis DAH-3]|uniref:Nucleoporin NUP133 n=1 Tax=Neolecta irregularis (strain DAH-3) TaxID=1198029 RepID=A0A1U7LI43_NEOID|nr:Nucleoporin NUP133 [Neolecta irregularis DAH-3]|eukprot:OLL22298.1 Nucleoporin NUP133 [Neolecta irregularis DAH-3]